jgi:serine protease
MKVFAVLAALALQAACAFAAVPGDPPTARVIVAYRDGAGLTAAHPWRKGASAADVRRASQKRADALTRRAGVALTTGRAIGQRAQVLMAHGIDSATLASRLAADPDVAYAVVDQRRRALTVPNDPLFSAGSAVNLQTLTGGPVAGQWYLREPTDLFRSATNAQAAWARSTGADVVVAVLDTGVLFDHPDLRSAVLPGYDMVGYGAIQAGGQDLIQKAVASANDGDANDPDASDPGDWVTLAEAASGAYGSKCQPSESSWHGTRVAGIVAAATNNGIGMAGLAYGAKVLPVRVLGKCGGYDSDITAGMLWAAGIDQAGLPGSTTPAKVLNLSLGGGSPGCAAYQNAIADVTARGAVVVAAAGNSDGGPVGVPARCPGVIAVAGLRHAGTKVGFSDLGPEITISAPGGNCVNSGLGQPCLYPILTTSNSGLRGPAAGGSRYTDSFDISVGTSFATPMVAATAALILSVRPDLSPDQVKSALQSSARPFPTSGADNSIVPFLEVRRCDQPNRFDPNSEKDNYERDTQCYCTTALCGAGMLDAAVALTVAQALPSVVTPAQPSDGGGGALSWPWLLALALATALLSARPRRRPSVVVG